MANTHRSTRPSRSQSNLSTVAKASTAARAASEHSPAGVYSVTAAIGDDIIVAEFRSASDDHTALREAAERKCRLLAHRRPSSSRGNVVRVDFEVRSGHPHPDALFLSREARDASKSPSDRAEARQALQIQNKNRWHPMLAGTLDISYAEEWIARNGAIAFALAAHFDDDMGEPLLDDEGLGLDLDDIEKAALATEEKLIGDWVGWDNITGLTRSISWWIATAGILLAPDSGSPAPNFAGWRDRLIALERGFWNSLAGARSRYIWAFEASREGADAIGRAIRDYALYRSAVCELAQEVVSPDLCERLERRI